jgi:hypothetical protein
MIHQYHFQSVTKGDEVGSIFASYFEKAYQSFRDQRLVSMDVWNNSKRFDFKVFGRYANLYPEHGFHHQIIYTQDDDCVLDTDSFLPAYEPGVVTCNMPAHRRPEYSDGIALVGWGAIFDRNLTSVFNLYLKHYPLDDLFLTECDRIFTGLNKVKMIDVPFTNLPNAETPDRLHKRPDHWDRLSEIRQRVHRVKMLEGMG